jgi:hypothetical protein
MLLENLVIFVKSEEFSRTETLASQGAAAQSRAAMAISAE